MRIHSQREERNKVMRAQKSGRTACHEFWMYCMHGIAADVGKTGSLGE